MASAPDVIPSFSFVPVAAPFPLYSPGKDKPATSAATAAAAAEGETTSASAGAIPTAADMADVSLPAPVESSSTAAVAAKKTSLLSLKRDTLSAFNLSSSSPSLCTAHRPVLAQQDVSAGCSKMWTKAPDASTTSADALCCCGREEEEEEEGREEDLEAAALDLFFITEEETHIERDLINSEIERQTGDMTGASPMKEAKMQEMKQKDEGAASPTFVRSQAEKEKPMAGESYMPSFFPATRPEFTCRAGEVQQLRAEDFADEHRARHLLSFKKSMEDWKRYDPNGRNVVETHLLHAFTKKLMDMKPQTAEEFENACRHLRKTLRVAPSKQQILAAYENLTKPSPKGKRLSTAAYPSSSAATTQEQEDFFSSSSSSSSSSAAVALQKENSLSSSSVCDVSSSAETQDETFLPSSSSCSSSLSSSSSSRLPPSSFSSSSAGGGGGIEQQNGRTKKEKVNPQQSSPQVQSPKEEEEEEHQQQQQRKQRKQEQQQQQEHLQCSNHISQPEKGDFSRNSLLLAEQQQEPQQEKATWRQKEYSFVASEDAAAERATGEGGAKAKKDERTAKITTTDIGSRGTAKTGMLAAKQQERNHGGEEEGQNTKEEQAEEEEEEKEQQQQKQRDEEEEEKRRRRSTANSEDLDPSPQQQIEERKTQSKTNGLAVAGVAGEEEYRSPTCSNCSDTCCERPLLSNNNNALQNTHSPVKRERKRSI